MDKYEFIDISGDAGLKIFGADLREVFIHGAMGFYSLITDAENVRPIEERRITMSADDREGLLIQWLNELVFLFDAYGFIGRDFQLTLSGLTLNAVVQGGYFDESVNERRLLVKATTYHGLYIRETENGCEAAVLFDL
jgi:SHS2 domain-containing protein